MEISLKELFFEGVPNLVTPTARPRSLAGACTISSLIPMAIRFSSVMPATRKLRGTGKTRFPSSEWLGDSLGEWRVATKVLGKSFQLHSEPRDPSLFRKPFKTRRGSGSGF